MANKFQKGHTFVPGEVVDPDDLNNLVDLATALPPLITDQTSVNANTGDKVLVVRGSQLRQADVSTFPAGVTSVSWAAGNPAPTNVFSGSVAHNLADAQISLGLDAQGPNKVLAGPISGSNITPAFRLLTPPDLNKLVSISVRMIDLDLGNTFWKVLSATDTFRLKNGTPGQVIKVIMIQPPSGPANFNVSWVADAATGVVRWPGGTHPVQTHGANAADIYEFTYLQVSTGPDNYYGVRWGANFQI